MKMKRLVSGALVAVSLATFMTGCINKDEVKEPSKVENKSGQVDKDKNEVGTKVYDEFLKVLEGNNVLETKEFIVNNIQNVSEEIADKMVVEYELLLKNNFVDLANKFNSDRYFTAINETKDVEYKLNLDAIKDEEIKEEVKNIVASGYTFKMAEGDYYLTMDYAMINDTFGKHISENIKTYYELRKKELEHPTYSEEYINIDFEEIKNRVVTLEKFIKDNTEFKNKEDLKDMMRWYVQALLSVDYISNTVDFETGEVKEIVKNTYEELKLSDLKITKEAVEEMDVLLAEYQYALKSDNKDAYNKVYDLKFKITEQVNTKVEEYYFNK